MLVSGRGSNLQAVLDACADGRLDAEVVAVVSNRRKAFGLERARAAGVEAVYAPRKGHADRDAYDAALADLVAARRPDVVVLAGWMYILGAGFLSRFPGRVINLHPALPGAFPGLHAIERAWEAARDEGLDHTGVMVHHAVPEVDAGPVVAQEAVPLDPDEPLEALFTRMHAVEHRLLVEATRRVLAARADAAELTLQTEAGGDR